ncbi:hypothetical protein SAY86_000545 [Trapa natans]|uniref:Uncharacterized protein n=1 Tax=Trapa natans TaxID=22666 RepID=A0AAN7MNR2_TRANT|nr:hypothetical protein SAY86_000545 [Trapa natans]
MTMPQSNSMHLQYDQYEPLRGVLPREGTGTGEGGAVCGGGTLSHRPRAASPVDRVVAAP